MLVLCKFLILGINLMQIPMVRYSRRKNSTVLFFFFRSIAHGVHDLQPFGLAYSLWLCHHRQENWQYRNVTGICENICLVSISFFIGTYWSLVYYFLGENLKIKINLTRFLFAILLQNYYPLFLFFCFSFYISLCRLIINSWRQPIL